MIVIETVVFDSDSEKRARAVSAVKAACDKSLRPCKSATSVFAEIEDRSEAGKILHAIICAVRDDCAATINVDGDGISEMIKTQGDGSAMRYHGPSFDVGVPYVYE